MECSRAISAEPTVALATSSWAVASAGLISLPVRELEPSWL